MCCLSNDELCSDWQRSRSGEPMRHASHIAECEKCRSAIIELNMMRSAVASTDRHDHEGCLSPEIMNALVEGTLPSNEQAAVNSHLATCRNCREAVVGASEYTREMNPAKSRGWAPVWRVGAVLAPISAAAYMGLLFFGSHPTTTPVTIQGSPGMSQTHQDLNTIQGVELAIKAQQKIVDKKPTDKAAKERLTELQKQLEWLKKRQQ